MNEELINAIKENNIIGVKKALIKGADVNAYDERKNPALIIAIIFCDRSLNIIKLLIERGADIRAKSDAYDNPIVTATIVGRLDIIKLLVEKGADINQTNRIGLTSLLLSSYYNDIDTVTYLLNHGADPMIKNSRGFTALDVAIHNENFEVADLIRSHMLEQSLIGLCNHA